jgi:hypothetical protein
MLALLTLTACAGGAPRVVIVTPTVASSPVPTLAAQVEQPLSTTSVTRAPLVVGAVVDAAYTLPPSATPEVRVAPTETVPARPVLATAAMSATPLPSPTSTPPEPTVLPTLTPTPIPLLDRTRMGIQVASNMGRAEWDASLSRAKELGVEWIKVQLNWAFLQPNGQDPNHELLKLFEINLETAKQFGFKVMLGTAKAPAWARNGDPASGPPGNPQTFADFLTMIFTQTKIGASIDAIEIWNEPNLRAEWATDQYGFDGASYMRLFAPAYGAVRGYRQDLTIIVAALAPTGDSEGTRNDRAYLQEMYDAGLGNYRDVVMGVHPYGWANPPDARCCDPSPERGWDDQPQFFFLDTLEDTRAIMTRNGHGDIPIWVTEFGWTVWEDLGVQIPEPVENHLWKLENSPQEQADYALRAFELGLSRPDVGVMILWNLNFASPLPIQNRDETVGYSLLIMDEAKMQFTSARPLFYLLPFATRGTP